MGCGSSVPCPYPHLIGLWVSDDVKNKESLLANHEREKQASHYSCEKGKRTSFYKPCNGAVLEIAASGYVNYIEMDGVWAHSIYSGPITNWDGPDGVWTGCCADCCFCCKKGCVHFDVEMPGSQIQVNGRIFSKECPTEEEEMEMEIPVVLASPVKCESNKPINPDYHHENLNFPQYDIRCQAIVVLSIVAYKQGRLDTTLIKLLSSS